MTVNNLLLDIDMSVKKFTNCSIIPLSCSQLLVNDGDSRKKF